MAMLIHVLTMLTLLQSTFAWADSRPVLLPTAPKCEAKADIVFLLDASGSVQLANFQKVKTFVHNLMNDFNIGPNAVQVGVVTFATTVTTQFSMNTYKDRQSLQAAINKTTYSTGGTNTGAAILFMRKNSFSAAQGDRPNVVNVGITITDGKSDIASQTADEAKKARDAGIIMFAIGVGSGINVTELKAIASAPDSSYVFTSANFDVLKSLEAVLTKQVCKATLPPPPLPISTPPVRTTKPAPRPNPTLLPTAPKCEAKADIMFLLDASGSVQLENFQKVKTFVYDLMNDFNIGPHAVQVGVVTFATTVALQFNMNTYRDRQSLQAAINKTTYSTGGTNTAAAIKFMRENSFSVTKGDRPNVVNVGITITDGKSDKASYTADEAKKARDAGIIMFAIGVGSGINVTELKAIASAPDSSYVFTSTNFDVLKSLKAVLTKQVCKATLPPSTPPTSTPPVRTTKPAPRPESTPSACRGRQSDTCQRDCRFRPGVFFFAYYNSRMTKVPRSQCINPLSLSEKSSSRLVVFRRISANFGNAYRSGSFRAPVSGLYRFDVNFQFTGILKACVYLNNRCYAKIGMKGKNAVAQRTIMIRLRQGSNVSVSMLTGGEGSVRCRPLAAYFSGELLAKYSCKP